MRLFGTITSQFSNNKIEFFLRKILPYYFCFIFITTIFGAVIGYLEYNSWKIGDWLINYHGGFVRRGLFGELIIMISICTKINPGFFVVIFQILFYTIFLFFSYQLLINQKKLFPYIILIFSPFIFLFHLIELQGGYRKEIIFFAFFSFIIWTAKLKSNNFFEKSFYLFLFVYPLLILSHEMLAVLLPYLIMIFILKNSLTVKKIMTVSILLILSIAAFLLSVIYSGTHEQIEKIFYSISQLNYPINDGAISFLDKSITYSTIDIFNHIKNNHGILFLLLVLFLSSLAYFPIYDKIKILLKNKLIVLLLIFSLSGTVILFFIAFDWGRLIYMHLVSLFLLILFFPDIENHKNDNKNMKLPIFKKIITFFFLIFIVLYSSVWRIYYGCIINPINNHYKIINQVKIIKTYFILIEKINNKNK